MLTLRRPKGRGQSDTRAGRAPKSAPQVQGWGVPRSAAEYPSVSDASGLLEILRGNLVEKFAELLDLLLLGLFAGKLNSGLIEHFFGPVDRYLGS